MWEFLASKPSFLFVCVVPLKKTYSPRRAAEAIRGNIMASFEDILSTCQVKKGHECELTSVKSELISKLSVPYTIFKFRLRTGSPGGLDPTSRPSIIPTSSPVEGTLPLWSGIGLAISFNSFFTDL